MLLPRAGAGPGCEQRGLHPERSRLEDGLRAHHCHKHQPRGGPDIAQRARVSRALAGAQHRVVSAGHGCNCGLRGTLCPGVFSAPL